MVIHDTECPSVKTATTKTQTQCAIVWAITVALLGGIQFEVGNPVHVFVSLAKKATIRQLTTMLSTSKNVQFPGHNHLLTTCTDDPSL